MIRFIAQTFLTSLLMIVANAQTFTWMPFLQGSNKVPIADSLSGSPTFALVNIESPIAFSKLAIRIVQADADPTHLYANGVFACSPNQYGLASDCAQPGAVVTPICTTLPRPLTRVSTSSTGPQLDDCREGPGVAQPGTYAVMGVGTAPNAAFCQGRQGNNSTIPTFVYGSAVNGDFHVISNPKMNVPYFTTMKVYRFTADACAISLEN